MVIGNLYQTGHPPFLYAISLIFRIREGISVPRRYGGPRSEQIGSVKEHGQDRGNKRIMLITLHITH